MFSGPDPYLDPLLSVCVGVSVRVLNAAAYNINVQVTPCFRQNNSEAFYFYKVLQSI